MEAPSLIGIKRRGKIGRGGKGQRREREKRGKFKNF
jgi:hypothetical protein